GGGGWGWGQPLVEGGGGGGGGGEGRGSRRAEALAQSWWSQVQARSTRSASPGARRPVRAATRGAAAGRGEVKSRAVTGWAAVARAPARVSAMTLLRMVRDMKPPSCSPSRPGAGMAAGPCGALQLVADYFNTPGPSVKIPF